METDLVPTQPVEVVPSEAERLRLDLSGEEVSLADTLVEEGLILPQITAEALIGATFTVRGVRVFESALTPGRPVLYCQIDLNGEAYGVVLGGQVVVDKILTYLATGNRRPFTMTLVQKQGGKYGRYYDIA